MTLPIPFVTTPVADSAEPADAEDSFGSTATTTDANFEKINAFLRAEVYQVATSDQTGEPETYTTNAWTAFTSDLWAPISVMLPTRCTGLMIGVGARMYHDDPESASRLYLSFAITGAVTYSLNEHYRCMLADKQWLSGSVVVTLTGSELTPGGTVIITPNYFLEATGADPGVATAYGHLWAIATA